jgi:hypothetical protein
MSPLIEQLEAALFDLKGERNALEATRTKEDLVTGVDEWLEAARARAAGSSRFVLSGRPVGEDLEALLAEDLLADDALAGRVVKRLEARRFGAVSARAKRQQLAKLDEAIVKATGELREARKQDAIAAVEAQYAGA